MLLRITTLTAFIASLFVATASLQAQEFKTSVGARLGVPISASVKHFLNESDAVEAYVGFRGNSLYNWFNVNAAYQRHSSLNLDAELSNLNWYYGAGAGVYVFSYDFGPAFNEDDFSSLSFGISGYLGLQYAFDGVPIELTADWVPTIFIGSGFVSGFGAGYGNLGVRYILGR